MKKRIFSIIILTSILLGSCSKIDDFLDVPPSKTSELEIKTFDQLNQLLNNYSAVFSEEVNQTAAFSSDDYYLSSAMYDSDPSVFAISRVKYALWDSKFLTTNIGDDFWGNEYKKIFYANTVLTYLDQVSGGTIEQKNNLKAEAHFIRAYSNWVLVNTYCLPYTEANKNEPGLPIKQTISFEENAQRQSLATTYQQIESDLTEALKISMPLVQSGRSVHWRANKTAVNAFAARYWLNRNDYNKALQFANEALAGYSTLVDYNTQIRYGIPKTVTLDAGTASQKNFTIQFPYTHNNQVEYTDMIGWKEFLYFRMLANDSYWYIPSPELLNLYDKEHDLRYKYNVVEGYSYDRGMIKPSYDYPGYVFFYKNRIPSGPTVAEVLLTKAEAQAHLGNAAASMQTLNSLRAKRMVAGAWVNLSAANKEDAIKKVSEERRREMPFSQRWFDVRRYNHNEIATDDIQLKRSFYPFNNSIVLDDQKVQNYTLEKGSRRWAAPIPVSDIEASNGVIEQNKY